MPDLFRDDVGVGTMQSLIISGTAGNAPCRAQEANIDTLNSITLLI